MSDDDNNNGDEPDDKEHVEGENAADQEADGKADNVIALQKVLAGGKRGPAAPVPNSPADIGGGRYRPVTDFDIEAMNDIYAFVTIGGRSAVLRETHKMLPPPPIDKPIVEDRFHLLQVNAFKDYHSDEWFQREDEKLISAGQLWMQHPQRRKYLGMTFEPDGNVPGKYFNMFNGWAIEPSAEGSCELLKDHLRDNVCDDDEDLFNRAFGWCADIFQNPTARHGIALVLQGPKGVGKTILGHVIGRLLGSHYFLAANARYVTGQFNMHLAQTLLLHADEALWAGDRQHEGVLRDLITGAVHSVEPKGVDSFRVRNYTRLLITSEEDWVVPAGRDERRFFVLEVAPNNKQDRGYFGAIIDELENGGYQRLLWELQNFDLSKAKLGTAPVTSGLIDQKLKSLPPHFKWWFECLDRGWIVEGLWHDALIKQRVFKSYRSYCQSMQIRHPVDDSEIAKRVMNILVPDIKEKRGSIVEHQDENGEPMPGRPRMWLLASLEKCREAFEAWVGGPVDWPPLDSELIDDPGSEVTPEDMGYSE